MSHWKSLVLTGLALLLWAPNAFGQTWPTLQDASPVVATGENDVALLIAIEDYAFLPDVAGATANLTAWERFLRRDVGVPTVLVLKDQQAVREEILDFAQRAAEASSADGRLWFVFIGHGAPNKDADDGLLIGADGQQTMSSMMARSVSRTEILRILEAGEQRETVALLDACFSGRDSEGNALAKGVQPVLPVNSAIPLPRGAVVMTAASANEVAGQLPDEERPAFSYLMLGAMRGWADDGDGIVTAAEATAFASSELLAVPGRRQTPQLSGLEQMVLSRGATEPRPAKAVSTAASDRKGRTDQVTQSAPATEEPATPDNRHKVPFFAKIGVGVGGPGIITDPSVGVAGDFGIKFDALTEVRAALWLNYFSRTNDAALQGGDTVDTTDGGAQQEVDDGDPVTNVRDHLGLIGIGPGIGFRSAKSVFYIDSAIGSAVWIGGECTRWQTEVLSREAVCDLSSDRSEFFAGARVGYSYTWFDFSLVATFIADVGLVGGINLGFSYDQ